MKDKLIGDRMLLFFELEKELGDERTQGGNKNYKVIARRLYKSFGKSYPWISINKDWSLRYFRHISSKLDIDRVQSSRRGEYVAKSKFTK